MLDGPAVRRLLRDGAILLAVACQRQEPAPSAAVASAGQSPPNAERPAGLPGERPHDPSGRWCGSRAAARATAYEQSPEQLDCPRFLDGERQPWDAGAEYEEFPRTTRAFLDLERTRNAQAEDPARCCYLWREKAPGGRPFLDTAGAPRTAELVQGAAWSRGVGATRRWRGRREGRDSGARRAPPGARERELRTLAEEAAGEHASVASFARAAVEILAAGGPWDLVRGCHRAARDEVRHARMILALLGRRGAVQVPSTLEAPPPRPVTIERLVDATVREGLLAESRAVAEAVLDLGAGLEGADRRVRRRVAEDELRHVGLAVAVLEWATRQVRARALLVEHRQRLEAEPGERGAERLSRNVLALPALRALTGAYT